MHNPYRELFTPPGTRGMVLAGLLARLPLPMTGIAIITLLSQWHGSYALAGAVSATFVLTYAVLSPQISRCVDRHGQRRVLPIATGISVMGMLLLLASTRWDAPTAFLFVGALLAGFMPSMSAMVRARWAAIHSDRQTLQTAQSLETVLDEATFIAGPPLAVGLSVAVFPQAGLLAGAVLLMLGMLALVAQRTAQPPVQTGHIAADAAGSVIRHANVGLLALLMVAMGIIVGTVDIVSVAFAEQQGRPAMASAVLSAYAAGSCAAGLVFGALRWRTPLHRLLMVGGAATAATTLPLLFVDGIATLAVAVLVAGWFFAPTMIVAMTWVERLVPAHRVTEGMTWLLAGLNVGVALGASISGQLVDVHGAQAGFRVAVGAGALVLLFALVASHRLGARAAENNGLTGSANTTGIHHA